MTFQVIPRTEIGLSAQVLNSHGNPRPRLADCPYLVVHYTGVRLHYPDRDVPATIRQLEAWTALRFIPNEYNYVIGQPDDDNVYEYAGPYQAAHCKGHNHHSIGVLMLNGIDEELSDTQIDKLRWLRDYVLKGYGVVRLDVDQRPHREMPGAATACPGESIMSRWPELLTPWDGGAPDTPPPAPTAHVLHTTVRPGDGWYSIARRVYGTSDVADNADALAVANPSVIHPGDIVVVPGRAVR